MKGNNGLYYSYNSVFSEYTTKGQGISCSNYANCYIGCTCRSGWNKRSASASDIVDGGSLKTAGAKAVSTAGTKANVSTMAEGDSCTVSITDPRYGTTCSISTTKDCAGVCDGSAEFRCTSGSTSSYCPSGQYSVYLGKQQCSSGSATNSQSCYTCRDCSYSCPNGYYTSAGSGYYLTSTSKYQVCNGDSSQTNSTKCYTRATCSYSCPSGYATSAGSGYYLTSNSKYQVCNGDSSQTNSTKCYERKACSYSCPSGYYTSAGSGYYLTSNSKYQVCNGDSSQTNSTKCYERKACSYTCPSGYSDTVTSCSEGYSLQTATATPVNSQCKKQVTCGKCVYDKPEYYKIRVVLVGIGSNTNQRSIPVNTRLKWDSQYNDYLSKNTEYETETPSNTSSGEGIIEMGLSCYNGIKDANGNPLFPTIIVNGEVSGRNLWGGQKSKSFSYEINCGWPRASLEGKIGSNGAMPFIANGLSANQDPSKMNISDLEVYISGIGYVDENDTFTYNGKNYKIQFDITKDKRSYVGFTGKPSSLHPAWDCPGKGEGDKSWPNCD